MFRYISGIITWGDAAHSVTKRIKSWWSKFKKLVSLLASRGFPLEAKGRIFSACLCSLTLYESETVPVKEKDVISLERSDARMISWISRYLMIEFLQRSFRLDGNYEAWVNVCRIEHYDGRGRNKGNFFWTDINLLIC